MVLLAPPELALGAVDGVAMGGVLSALLLATPAGDRAAVVCAAGSLPAALGFTS